MAKASKGPPPWQAVANRVARTRSADILMFSGGIYEPTETELTTMVQSCRSRANVMLILTTLGGSPDSAYRLARCLREEYKGGEFILFVDAECKSAGTLIALGAHKIVMSDEAELGPLDVQVYKHDEVGEFPSGLTPIQALTTLRTETFKQWEDGFRKLRYRHSFSTRMAALIAAKMSIGLFRPIYEQIDPMRLGENERAMMIGYHYGQRLKTENVKEGSIDRLLVSYPSHGFVIDRSEAKTLFSDVKKPTADEQLLASAVDELQKEGQASDARQGTAKILFLSTNSSKKIDSTGDGEGNGKGSRKPRTAAAGARSDFRTPARNGGPKSDGAIVPARSSSNGNSDRPKRRTRRR